MANEHDDLLITSEEVQAAITGGQLSLCYQPKIDCETLSLKGFEALIRWNHPTKGLILPREFIKVAEDAGLIGKITEMVINEAFQWYTTTNGVQSLGLSINISAKRLSDLDFADWLRKKCVASGIRTEAVTLEISESAVITERLHALDMFTRLQTKGFRVAIDGFGIANSNLAMLAKLPFAEIKIEKSFAMTATQSEASKTFLRSTIQQCHSLRLEVVAEGVEDRETLEFLRELGCDYIHGYLVAQPMTGEQTRDWILNRRKMTRHILV
jgi:EAL domain-containing protein (putative c-di-GMP-specific phosphodiesterase class I)